MRLLFVGDVVGRAGRKIVLDELPGLRARYKADFVVLNGENAAGGFGITETICQQFLDAGADVVTTGNHVWDQREALVFIERQERLLRPLNYPEGTPGRGAGLFKAANGSDVLVINPMGRVFTCLDRGLLGPSWVDIWFYDPADGWAWQQLIGGTYSDITIVA